MNTNEQKLDFDFIGRALNHYWNDALSNLGRKDLGDIERNNYEYQKSKSFDQLQVINDNESKLNSYEPMQQRIKEIIEYMHRNVPSVQSKSYSPWISVRNSLESLLQSSKQL